MIGSALRDADQGWECGKRVDVHVRLDQAVDFGLWKEFWTHSKPDRVDGGVSLEHGSPGLGRGVGQADGEKQQERDHGATPVQP